MTSSSSLSSDIIKDDVRDSQQLLRDSVQEQLLPDPGARVLHHPGREAEVAEDMQEQDASGETVVR